MKSQIALFTVFLCMAAALSADDWLEERGDPAIADRYLLWAEDAIKAGQWQRARAALERATDFSSSDILYLLAVVYSHENESRYLVLQALDKAIGTGNWRRYDEAQARLLEAEQKITIRRYSDALDSLAAYRAAAGDTADSAVLRLVALKGLANRTNSAWNPEFLRRLLETMNRYPRDPRPVKILFDYALGLKSAGKNPDRHDLALIDLALKRLPFILTSDPNLAWMAAHFMNNDDEARRLTEAYRAGQYAAVPVNPAPGSFLLRANDHFKPNPASLVPALNLGLIDDIDALEELFAGDVLNKDLIIDIGNLLRSDEGWDRLAEKLHVYTGVITEDNDRDGFAECRAVYTLGKLREYYCDDDQDGITTMFISLSAGDPHRTDFKPLPSFLLMPGDATVSVFWERYPSVQKVVLGDETYLFAPGAFLYSPVNFVELGASGTYSGLIFPRRDPLSADLNRRMLTSFANMIQRPSADFDSGTEHILLDHGMPVRAEVHLNNMLVSVTEFENGSPIMQRFDMDLDGKMETERRITQ